MAMGDSSIVFSLQLILLLQSSLSFSEKNDDYKGANENHENDINVIKVASVLPPTTCSASTIKGPNMRHSLKIVHRHGPCSQSSKGKTKSLDQLFEEMLEQDQIRVASLHYKLSNKPRKAQIVDINDKKTTLPAKSGLSLGTGNYIVEIGFGTPAQSMSIEFDTGSDLTWIPCETCVTDCRDQKDKKFDPSKSTTYSNITCNTSVCSELEPATGITPSCASSTCRYGIQYGDGSFSIGFFAKEKLTVTPSDVFQSFKFGCDQNNQNLSGSSTAGLLGLGRDKLSFVSQTIGKYAGVFSYCLPSSSNSAGYLSLGPEENYASVKFTPMKTDSRSPSFYSLNIIAIMVGNQKLPISASVFATSGFIIDSGTVITRLPPDAYTALKTAFRQAMSSYPLTQPFSLFDTCYNFTGYDQVRVPKIAFIFEGNVAVDISGVLTGIDVSQLCLAFAGNRDVGIAIFGNLQQRKLKVVYDVPKKRIGFGPGNCS